jgi:hemoglobin-like flavoprotein
MTPEQIHHVRASFARLLPIAEPAAALFYGNLFKADPSLRTMFKGDMAQQGVKLMQMIGAAVGLLDKQHVLLPLLRQLGARHAGYGVQPQHYVTVQFALLKTLEQGLGTDFTPATREAWVTMMTLVSGLMIEAAAQHEREAA